MQTTHAYICQMMDMGKDDGDDGEGDGCCCAGSSFPSVYVLASERFS